jgi:choline dehydrogenase-like flavoprotein
MNNRAARMDIGARPVRHLRTLLTVLAALFGLAAILYELGPLVGPLTTFSRQLPFVTNSVVNVSVLMMCCLYAAGDPARRLGLVRIVIGGHLVSVAAMVAMLAFKDTSARVPLSGAAFTIHDFLLGAIALDGVIIVVFLVFYLAARGVEQSTVARPVAGADRVLRVALIVFGILFVLAAGFYEAGPFLPGMSAFFIELPFVTNSVVKVSVLAMLCFYAARDLEHRRSVVGIVIAGHVVSGLALAIMLVATDTSTTVQVLGRTSTLQQMIVGAIGLDAGIAVILVVLYMAAWRARYPAQFFGTLEMRTFMALAEVVVPDPDKVVPPEDVAAGVDRHIAQMQARRRWVYHGVLLGIQLHPLLYLKAPLSELDPATRLKHLKDHFRRDVLRRLVPMWWQIVVQAMIRVAQQLVYVGYYNDPRTFKSVGYVRFTERPRYHTLNIPPRGPHPLQVDRPSDLSGDTIDTDVCVIGSGAGGAIIAYNLAKAGRDVLVVERGKYVEPRDFGEDEVEMMGKLYADGLFQQTTDYRFTVLQGSCVGGSTVVNNAVCFDPPPAVVARWNDPAQHEAGLHVGDLTASTAEIRRFLDIQSQRNTRLNPTGPLVAKGVTDLGLNGKIDVQAVDANIKDCFGCGYCNIGCAYGKKLSMLDVTLPKAQHDFPGKVRIVAECPVDRLRVVSGPTSRVTEARATLSDGRRVTIRARTFVVSAGAIASSYLLLRSGIGRRLPVGEHLAFNMGTALTAEVDRDLDAYDGLQIGHYAKPMDTGAYVYETWWNPPVAQAVNMPGWFEEHYENMRKYRRLVAVGLLVGTAGTARVQQALTGGPDIAFVPDPKDLKTLGDACVQMGRILLKAGATRVMANTWGSDVFKTPDELDRFHEIVKRPGYLATGTGHPQGGNAISKDPARGVVGPDFRVHGYANLYVCDASVFPTSLTVNPQLTVMTLAHYASTRIR